MELTLFQQQFINQLIMKKIIFISLILVLATSAFAQTAGTDYYPGNGVNGGFNGKTVDSHSWNENQLHSIIIGLSGYTSPDMKSAYVSVGANREALNNIANGTPSMKYTSGSTKNSSFNGVTGSVHGTIPARTQYLEVKNITFAGNMVITDVLCFKTENLCFNFMPEYSSRTVVGGANPNPTPNPGPTAPTFTGSCLRTKADLKINLLPARLSAWEVEIKGGYRLNGQFDVWAEKRNLNKVGDVEKMKLNMTTRNGKGYYLFIFNGSYTVGDTFQVKIWDENVPADSACDAIKFEVVALGTPTKKVDVPLEANSDISVKENGPCFCQDDKENGTLSIINDQPTDKILIGKKGSKTAETVEFGTPYTGKIGDYEVTVIRGGKVIYNKNHEISGNMPPDWCCDTKAIVIDEEIEIITVKETKKPGSVVKGIAVGSLFAALVGGVITYFVWKGHDKNGKPIFGSPRGDAYLPGVNINGNPLNDAELPK
jgi:hypothetical protein